MSLSDVLPLTTIIKLLDSIYGTQIRLTGKEFCQILFSTFNETFRHHFHKVHHDVVSPTIAGVKVDLRAFPHTHTHEIKESQLL